jgi:acyl-CoA dehydrogenase
VSTEITQITRSFLAAKAGPAVVREAEEGRHFLDGVWKGIEEIGLPLVSVPEEAGGSGGTLEDAGEILRSAGYHATPLPIAETGILAGWILSQAGLDVPAGPMTVGPVMPGETARLEANPDGWTMTASLSRIPWGDAARTLAIAATGDDHTEHVVVVPRSAYSVVHDTNLAGEPRDTVKIGISSSTPGAAASPVAAGTRRLLYARGALARANLTAGALERITEITIRYAKERRQFGRPISSFQAVQSHIVRLAGQHSGSQVAAVAATQRFEDDPSPELIAALAASFTAKAGRIGAAAAHQAHGAIGMTAEYDLQLFTRRIAAWSDEFGSQTYWDRVIGQHIARAGHASLWDLVTAP